MNLTDFKNYLLLVNPDPTNFVFLLRDDSLSIFNRKASITYIKSILIKEGIEENTFSIFTENNQLSNYFSWLYDVLDITLLKDTKTREHSFQDYIVRLKY